MTKVWVVEGYTPYESSQTIGIFSTEERANNCRDKAAAARYWDYYEVYEYTLDESE